jgi:membrane protein DedA with SNARE-associated domain
MSALILFFLALLQEDVAIVTAAFFVVEKQVSLPLALGLVYSGVVTSNLSIYGVGTLARRLPAARRWLINERVERVRGKLEQHLASAVLLCRLAPGLLLPTFLGCGWLGVPFPRFALLAMVAAAVYVSLMLTLVMTFGDIVLQRLGRWAWLVLGALVVAAVLIAARARIGASTGRSR